MTSDYHTNTVFHVMRVPTFKMAEIIVKWSLAQNGKPSTIFVHKSDLNDLSPRHQRSNLVLTTKMFCQFDFFFRPITKPTRSWMYLKIVYCLPLYASWKFQIEYRHVAWDKVDKKRSKNIFFKKFASQIRKLKHIPAIKIW